MRIKTSDKAIAYLTLLSGLTISAVAIYYSVAGLVSIFAAAAVPIIVMGVALEISKLIATVWLKLNWTRAPVFIRGYLLGAIAILMVITSMGIFGFLSKAHSDQSLVSGDVQAKISVYDEKIKTAKDNIDANRKALKQMDDAVDQVMGRSSDEKGADKAVAIRRGQQKERARLQSEIASEQKTIAALNEERAPIAAEVRKVEAEVGPIKYIANFIYGDNPDANVLEKAVTWVIIIIVSVFDPLAVILLLASQYSFQWFRKDEDEEELPIVQQSVEPEPEIDLDFVNQQLAEAVEQPEPEEPIVELVEEKVSSDPHPIGWMYPRHANIQDYKVGEDADEEFEGDGHDGMGSTLEDYPELEEELILNGVPDTEKKAMKAWKHDNPESSLKLQKRLLEKGLITELPWENYLKPQPDFAAEEAKKWAEENPQTVEAQEANEWANEKILTAGIDERPGDYVTPGLAYMENVEGQQVKKTVDGYTQNAEQGDDTLWKRIQDAKK